MTESLFNSTVLARVCVCEAWVCVKLVCVAFGVKKRLRPTHIKNILGENREAIKGKS